MASSSLLQVLTITLQSPYVSSRSSSSRRAAGSACSALRQTGLGQTLVHQAARQGLAQRRQAASLVVEAGQAGKAPADGGAAMNFGGSGGGGGSTPWQAVVAALDKRQPDAAWRLFTRVLEQGFLAPVAVCDRLISALCSKQRFRDAWSAYAAVQPAGYCLQYNTYQALISQALKAGSIESALEAFRDLQSQGLTANVVTYCGLISALGKERRRGLRYAATAAELWGELVASGAQLDAAAYRAGIKACVDVGKLKEADRVLQRMAAAGAKPDARAYNALLAGHARAAATAGPAGMSRLMQRMVAAGVSPSAVTFNTLIDGYVRARDLEAAKGVLAKAKAAEVALDSWSFSTLIKGYVQAGKLAAAETVLGDMAAAGVRPNCVTFSTLIDGHVRANDMAAAQRVLDAMLAAGEAPNAITYNSLLRGYASAAAASVGVSTASRREGGAAAALLFSGSSGSGGEGVAAAPATAQGRPSALAASLQLLQDMQAQGVSPTADTFNTLMAAAVRAEEPALAVEMHTRLRRAGLRPDALTYTTLIKAHGRLGRLADVAAAFESLLRDRSAAPDLRAYNAMVDALARNGDMGAAERMLGAATEFADSKGLHPPVEAYGAVVAGYARQLAVTPAVAVVKRFHAAGGSPDAQMLDLLANIAIRAGDYKVAMQSVRALELIGRDVDKGRYAALLQEVRARQAAATGADTATVMEPEPERGHNRTWAEYQRRREAKQRNVQLERFKFWLGLPNRYYSNDSDGEPSEPTVEEWDEWEQQQRWSDSQAR